jgi:ligand-binding sensor domain-containing protein
MQRLILTVLLVFGFFIYTMTADEFRLNNWQSHTSLLTGTACINGSGNELWFATEGGVFRYFPDTDTYEAFRNIDALKSLSVTCIAYDKDNEYLFVGQETGYLDIYDTKEDNWIHISDIRRADNYPDRSIRGIVFNDGKAYIGGGFGLAVFDIENFVFLENVVRIGDFATDTRVNDVIFENGRIILATSSGVASADITSSLTIPDSWTTNGEGLPDNGATEVIVTGEGMLCSNNKTLYIQVSTGEFEELLTMSYHAIINLEKKNNKLLFATENGVYDIDRKKMQHPSENLINGVGVVDTDFEEDVPVFFEVNAGFTLLGENDTLEIVPDTPLANSFTDITSGPDGSVWIATDYLGSDYGKSFLRLKNDEWTIYEKGMSGLNDNNYNKIACDNNGKLFVSNFGHGLYIGNPDGERYDFELFNNENSLLAGSAEKPQWVMPGEVRFDPSGTAWIVNNGISQGGDILVSLDKNGKFRSYANSDASAYRNIYSLGIDIYGTKWVGGYPGAGKGLHYFNEMNTPDDKSDDISGVVYAGSSSGLPSNEHYSIESDYSGMLWIGTPSGLALMVYPNLILSGDDPVIVEIESLSGQIINDIYIDSRDLKWIATGNNGVWVLSGTGEEVVAHINKDNSPLTTNEVQSVYVDENTGIVYFGTLEGLFTARSLSIKPNEVYDIKCFPQPFDLKKHEECSIDGLGTASEVKVMTVDGETVRTLSTTGRLVIWDGKDESGTLVPTGIYLVVGKSGDSDQAGVGKIAVVR